MIKLKKAVVDLERSEDYEEEKNEMKDLSRRLSKEGLYVTRLAIVRVVTRTGRRHSGNYYLALCRHLLMIVYLEGEGKSTH